MKQMENESYSGNIAAAATQSVKEREYWLDKLAGNPGKSLFPYDFEKNVNGPRRMETVGFQLPGEIFSRLLWMSNESDARLLMILMAGVMLLLNKYNGSRDIIVGMPIYKQDVKGEGNFINTVVVIRCEPREDMTFKEFLYQVKQTIDEAIKNQNYPIKALLYDLNLPFSQEDFPLFDITVMVENVQERKYIQHIPDNMGFSFLRTKECLEGTVEYNGSLYHKETVERIIACFIHLVGEAIFNANARLDHIDLLPGEERKKLLVDFNDTRKHNSEWRDKALHQLFEDQVEKTQDHIALEFDADALTYREYNKRSNRLARVLKEKGIGAESITAILMESSLEMVIVIMAVLKTGAAYLPIDREIPGERKTYMLEESGVSLLLTDDKQYPVSPSIPAGIDVVTACDEYNDGKESANPEFFKCSANLAYIIYTSGSTGKPKGVMVEHRQAVNTLVCRKGEYKMNPGDTALQLFSYAFDGFITSFFTPVISGARVVLLSKQSIEDIEKIIRVMVNCSVTHFISIPVLYQVILNSIRETGISGLKLKRVTLAGDKVLPNILEMSALEHKGIEIVNEYGITEAAVMSTLYRDQQRDAQVKIGRPAWNVAVYITAIGNHHQLVPIGIYGEMCIAGAGLTRGYMNNPELTAAKFDHDLWDYLDYHDKRNNKKLLWGVQGGSFLEKSPPGRRRQKIFQTGDLARWLPDGNIEFGGRMDHQVKIRGFRIEPGEVENRLLRCDGIKEAVVIAEGGASGSPGYIDEGDKYLCAYIVPGKELDLSSLRDNLAKNLPEYMIPAYFMQVDRIPLTSNGKVDRKALPEPEVKIGKDHIAPRNKIEEKLAEIWSEVLGIEKELIGIDSNFFEVGGHSLKATVLVSRVHKIFDVSVSMTDVFERTTLRELAEFIADSVKDKFASIEPAKNKDYYVLSSAQRRLYVLQQIKPGSPGYNIPLVVQIEGDFDVRRLENVFQVMIKRHESLRTSFEIVEDEPVQRIHPAHEVQFAVKHYDISNSSTGFGHQTGDRIEKIIADFVRPFDLSCTPLLRVGMIKLPHTPTALRGHPSQEGKENRYLLLLDMHHIISDEISLDIFERELTALYNGEVLPGLRLQYKDFSEWQNSSKIKALIKQQESYWLKKFRGSIPVLDLPVDYPRPAVRSFEGRSLVFHVKGKEAKALKELALRQGATMYMALLAVFNVLLAKISLREDIIVGTPVAGRRHADLEKIIGFFVNTLALRNYPSGEKTFTFFLDQVKENTLAAFENQDYQFEDLVEKVELERDMSRNPLFDVVFNFQSVFGTTGNVPPAEVEESEVGTGLKIKHYPYENRTAKFDLTLTAGEERDKLGLSFKYSTRLFREETVKRFIHYFKRIISTVVENPGIEISEIEIITEEEKKQALYDFNDTRAGYPGDKTIHGLFAEQAAKTPDNIAVAAQAGQIPNSKSQIPNKGVPFGQILNAFGANQLSYRELNKRSNQLAGVLKGKGVLADTIVGIMMERSIEMIIGLLGILKAGSAYLPVDPGYPGERINYMLADSSAKVLLKKSEIRISKSETNSNDQNSNDRNKIHVPIVLDFENLNFDIVSNFVLRASNLSSSEPAYIIYTSGTTGQPKGVTVTHGNVVRLMRNDRFRFNFSPGDTWTLFHSFCFDFSVWEMWGALLYGGKLVTVPDHIRQTPKAFLELLEREGVTVLNQIPTIFFHLMEEVLRSEKKRTLLLRYVIFGGDALNPSLLKRWYEQYPEVKLVNMYGITETTVHVTYKEIGSEEIEAGGSNIGMPIPTLTCFIVDRNLRLVPRGVAGEIVVGGDGVARGYLNRPELTCEKFTVNPYEKGDRLYRSGDLGKRLPNGDIEFAGRIDSQVKIRGYRIECGEIQGKLAALKGVKEALVTVKEDKSRNKYLAAYFTAEETVDQKACREYLKNLLPGYMIPEVFIQLDRFPLTPTGKIDREALPELEGGGGLGSLYEAPRNRIETQLVKIWQRVLGIDHIGINDDFFELGGNSIKGIHVVNKIQQWLEEIVHVTVLFEAPTIKELAAKLEVYAAVPEARVNEAKAAKMRAIVKPLAPLAVRFPRNPPAVFILSPPRSGTTLLRVILAGHPELFAPPELELLGFNTLEERKKVLSGRFGYFREGTLRAIMEIKNCSAEKAQKLMEELEDSRVTSQRFYGLMQEWLGKRMLIDKTPWYALDMETLKRAEDYFHEPRYIHLLRNPYAVIHSFEKARLDQIFRYTHNFSVRELAELVWLICNQNIIEFLQKIPAHRKHTLKFEELVHHPEPVVKGICDFLHIRYHEAMLRVYENTERKMTDGIYPESKMLGDINFFNHTAIDAGVNETWREKYKKEFLGDPTVQLAVSFGYLKEKTGPDYSKLEVVPKAEHYALSPAQKRLWVLDRFETGHIAYNMPDAYLFEGDLDIEILERAYHEVVKRHESLRTVFITIEGEPRQRILDFDAAGPRLEYTDLRGKTSSEALVRNLANEEAAVPFDLEKGPLLRVRLIHLDERKYALLFNMHHIICDGWSLRLLIGEVLAVYKAGKENKANPLGPLRFQYKDYSEWQNSQWVRERLEQQEEYWKEEFSGELPVLSLPTDYPRPPLQSFEGSAVGFELDEKESKKLNNLARTRGTTLFTLLSAVFAVFLSKLSSQEDIVVGTPIAGRWHPDLEQIIGMFVNTLALRSYPSGEKTFITFFKEANQGILKAFENQNFQFEELVEKVTVKRDMSRNPLFDVMFELNMTANANSRELLVEGIPGVSITRFPFDYRVSKFDLTLTGVEMEGKLFFSFEYCTKLFCEETIVRFGRYFKKVVSSIMENPGKKIAEIEIVTEEEKKQLLHDFNDTQAGYPRDQVIHGLFAEQVVKTPDHVALVGKEEGWKGGRMEGWKEAPFGQLNAFGEMHLSYRELNKRSNQLAMVLKEKGVLADTIVGIMVERSVEMIIGMLGVLKAGGAYLPIDPDYPQDRIDFMLKDSNAKILLTSREIANLSSPEAFNNRPKGTSSFGIWNLEFGISPRKGSQLAYIIYTSGSTGRPKGVLIEHSSVVNLAFSQIKHFNINNYERILQFSSLCFDASVEQIFISLFSGAALVLIDKDTILDSDKFEAFVTNHSITHINVVPSFLRQVELKNAPGLKRIILGGEVCPVDLAVDWSSVCDFYNQYGPTETTVTSIRMLFKREDVQDVVSGLPIGRPIDNTVVYILDRRMAWVPIGVAGELYIGGEGVARGYLNRPELTAERFKNKLYQTGDLGRWLPGGTIAFLGRVDHQVKIRGFRIELGEIENRLLNHREIKEAVVVVKEENLCAYFVSDGEIDASGLAEYLKNHLPGYMIPSCFMQLGKIPLTPNGKVNRKVLPGPEIKSGEVYIAPGNKVEEKLADIWSEVLGIKKDIIGIDANFFQLGGHSLNATNMIAKVHKELNVKLPLPVVFKIPTIKGLSGYILLSRDSRYVSIEPVEKREYYPLSSAQKRLYFLQQMDVNSTSYNMPMVLPPAKDMGKNRLEYTFKKLVARHESLRTSFIMLAGKPVQKIHRDVEFEIEHLNVDGWGERFVRPFDLSGAPLLRASLIKVGDGQFVLTVDIHHIVSDGTSHTILTEDFISLYNGVELEPLRLHYKDFSQWQNHLFASGEIKAQEEYWLGMYSGEIPRLDLPVDHKRPEVFTFSGARFGFKLEDEDAAEFKALGAANGATLYMNILAALDTLFYKYTGQRDIIIGSGTAGRPHIDLQQIIGMFVNILPMRNYPEGEKTYTSFLREVTVDSINAFENQDVQFEELVDRLDPERDPSRNPLFDIAMVVQNFRDVQVKEDVKLWAVSKNIPHVDPGNPTTKFDMTFFVHEAGNDVHINIEYYSAIFREETIHRLASHFKNVVKEVVKNPSITLVDMDILSQEEKQQVLYEYNNTARDYPADKTVCELFEEQAEKTPGNAAVVFENQWLSYGKLEGKSNELANYLYKGKNICAGDRVGLLVDRSIEMITAMLGIIKAGGAYVPIDPSLPEERIKTVINDGQIGVMISQKKYVRVLNRLQWECRCFHTFLCTDSMDIHGEEEAEKNELMDETLWEYVGQNAVDDITAGGWFSSYTGEPLSAKEMAEYGDNILAKLRPLLHENMRVLEIGCASGITMYRIAPKVGFYYGTDLSHIIIQRNKKRLQEKGHQNILLKCLPAHEVDKLEEKNYDLIILNSVIQSFHGHNYLRKVIGKSIDLLAEKGHIFIGDIMDQDLKKALIKETREFKQSDKGFDAKTKTDWSSELFVSRAFFEDLALEMHEIRGVEFSNKIYTIENELTKFRYDTLLRVEKEEKTGEKERGRTKLKYQHDLTALLPFDSHRPNRRAASRNLAYVIYTSGTTGEPKGVAVDHYAIVNTLSWRKAYYHFDENDTVLQLPSYSFDSSVEDIFTPLISGSLLVLIRQQHLFNLDYLGGLIEKHRVTHFLIVPAFYTTFLREIPQNLKKVKYITAAGDHFTEELVKDHMEKVPHIKLYNEYGPTENSVCTTVYEFAPGKTEVLVGVPIRNVSCYIISVDGKLNPVGAAGQLCISGVGLSRGYLNAPAFTAEKFVENPWIPGQKMYKTGDLARQLADGNILFLGRSDQQVKIRGYRIEPGEIEDRLRSHEAINDAVVIARERGEKTGDKYLCAYITAAGGDATPGKIPDNTELSEYLSHTLPDYMVPSFFIRLDHIPLTPNGKVDRKALPDPEIKTGEVHKAPRDRVEKKLTEIWTEVLFGTDASNAFSSISIEDNFFKLGGHSLKAILLVSKIHEQLNVKIPVAEIFKTPTIKGLAKYTRDAAQDRHLSILPVEKRDFYDVSYSQSQLWMANRFEVEQTAYTMVESYGFENLNPEVFEQSFRAVIQLHEILRTLFIEVKGEPKQKICDYRASGFKILRMDLRGEEEQDEAVKKLTNQESNRPFHLDKGPLVRAVLLHVSDLRWILLVTMHHIIADGWSMQILIDEIKALYNAFDSGEENPLPPLRIQYKDFAAWQHHQLSGENLNLHRDYWLEQFKGEIPVLQLETDFPRPAVKTYNGDVIGFHLDREICHGLKKINQDCHVTFLMTLAAAVTTLLYRYTLGEDVVIGLPLSGREHIDLKYQVGFYVNTLALRLNFAGAEPFENLLMQVKERVTGALDHQMYPFERLVNDLGLLRDRSRSPLFDVVVQFFNFEGIGMAGKEEKMSGVSTGRYHVDDETSKFDLVFNFNERENGLYGSLNYNTDLFEEVSIRIMVEKLQLIFRGIIQDPGTSLDDIDIEMEEEKEIGKQEGSVTFAFD